MLGIEDAGVWIAYLLCIASTLLCVVYGALNWNKGDEPVEAQDRQWAEHEKQAEENV